MKAKVLLLVLVFLCGGRAGMAQDKGAAGGPTASAAPANGQAPVDLADTPTAAAPAPQEEIIPLVTFDPDLPLGDVIKILAQEAKVNILIDPSLAGSKLQAPAGTLRLESVTARAALATVLEKHGLVLTRDPATDTSLVTAKSPAAGIPVAAVTTPPVATPPVATPPVATPPVATPPVTIPPVATPPAAVAAAPTATPQASDQPNTIAPPTNAPPAAATAPARDPNAPVDLAAQAPEAETDSIFDPNKEIPLLTAIQWLAKLAKINFLFDPKIRAPSTNGITVTNMTVDLSNLRNLTPQQMLEAVLDLHDLTMETNPKTGVARITFKQPGQKEPLITQVIHVKYSNLTNIVDLLKSSFTDQIRSKATADPRTSQIVVVCTQKEYEAATNLMAQLDLPTRQVLIEARLIETSKSPSTVKGIDWAGTLQNQSVSFGNGVTSGRTTTQLPGETTTATTPNGRPISSTSPMAASTALETLTGNGGLSVDTMRGVYPTTAFLNADGARAVLSFFNTDGESDVVSMPRAVMLDNQTATLAVTRAYPIFEITPGTPQTPPTAKITYTNLGTILTVTPKIAASSNINLKVVPEVSNIDSKDRQTINGQINEANVYAIRKIETQVTIPSGHTLVMGGLISDSTTKNFSKVPILGDIPGIGLAFRRESKDRRKINLIIFLTPTIVEDVDFHPTQTDFLQNKPPVMKDVDESAWNSGKPKEWRKSKTAEPDGKN